MPHALTCTRVLPLVLIPAAIFAQGAGPQPPALRAANRGGPWLSLRDGQAVHTEYSGDPAVVSALEMQQAQPLSLASAVFDEDGTPDLIAGYAAANGLGAVAVHRGNIDALWPYGKALRNGTPPPFLPGVRVFKLPEAPDFLGAGDFDADGHWDIVAARRGGHTLWLLCGDGHGGFGEAQRLDLNGAITAFATGEIDRPDGLTDFAVAISGENGARVLIFESPLGAWRADPAAFDLPAAASGLAIARLEHGPHSLVAAAGNQLVIVHGRDRRLTLGKSEQRKVPAATVTRQSFPFQLRSIAMGSFIGPTAELAALGDDGKVHILGYNAAPVPVAGHVVIRRGQPPTIAGASPAAAKAAPRSGPDWELRSEAAVPGGQNLVSGHISASGAGDVIVLDRDANRLHIVSPAPAKSGRKGMEFAASLDVAAGAPAAVLPMRLNQHPLSSLVALASNVMQPLVAVTNPANTFTVTNTSDSGAGSLRQAIDDAKVAAGASSIVFNIPTTDPNYNPFTGVFTIFALAEFPGATCSGTPPDGIGGSIGLDAVSSITTLDGYTQPGASPNTLTNSDNAFIPIRIDGSHDSTLGGNGLTISAYAFTVRGFHLTNWHNPCEPNSASGIDFEGAGFIEGNISGLDPLDLQLEDNDGGVYDSGPIIIGPGTIIGGTAPQARNLISGNASGYILDNGTEETVQGNYIGTDRAGTTGFGNQVAGVFLGGADSVIGGTTAGAGNLISGNGVANVQAFYQYPPQLNLIQGNLIGTDFTGANVPALPLPADGVWFTAADSFAGSGNTIGGTTPAARNIISGNFGTGVAVDDGGEDNIIQGNYIGTDITGAKALPNTADGVSLGVVPPFLSEDKQLTIPPTTAASNTTIGGAVAGAGNLISGNTLNGIEIDGLQNNFGEPPMNLVQGNLIGTDVTGSNSLANGGVGVLLGARTYNTTVGSYDTIPRNTIAFNGKAGVLIDPGPGPGNQNNPVLGNLIFSNGGDGVQIDSGNENPISRNSIYNNGGLGIDIGAGNPNINSNCQSNTTGANNSQNAPVLTSGSGDTLISATATDQNGNTSDFSNCAAVSGSTFSALGTFNGLPNKTFTIEFFQNTSCDPSGYGQGRTFIGSTTVTAGSNCSASINQSVSLTGADMGIALTNTDPPYPGSFGFATLTSVVTNKGAATATNVTVTDTLPPSFSLASATATQGACTVGGNGFTCTLGTMVSGATSTIAIQYTPLNATSVTDTITVSASQPDPNMANNTASLTINPPNLLPTIDQLDPPSVAAGSPALSLHLIGEGYIPGVTTATFKGTSVQVTGIATLTGNGNNSSNTGCYREATVCQQMTVLVPASLLTTAGTPLVAVANPSPGGGSSDISFSILSSCSYTVSPNATQNISAAAQTLDFSVTPAPAACTWNTLSSVPWMIPDMPGDFSQSGEPSFEVLPNGGSARSGTVTVAGQTITVNQAGGTCSLTLGAISESYTASGGTGQFFILENPTNCLSWSASSDSSWLTITSAAASDRQNDNGVITYSVASDSAMGARTGHINVPGAGVFTVQQLGVPSACDVNQDGKTNVVDAQLMIIEALGSIPAANDLVGSGWVNVVDIQIVTNAVMGLGCSAK